MRVSSTWAAQIYEPLLGRLLFGLRAEVMTLAARTEECGAKVRLLDCCCGAGGLLQGMVKVKKGAHVFLGLDMDAAMLQASQQRVPQAYLVRANALHIPLQDNTVSTATLCMALHTMPYEMALGVVRELMRVSNRIILADYCLAERNIYLPAVFLAHMVESMVGGEHFSAYKAFMARGALGGLLYEVDCVPRKRVSVLGGAAHVVVL